MSSKDSHLPPIEPETDQSESQEQDRHDDVIRFGYPGREADPAQDDRKDRRRAADRSENRSDAARRYERAVIHRSSLDGR